MRAALVGLLLLAAPLVAQERTHAVTPDDYFTLNSITEIAVSPDGKHVAYALAVWDKTEDNRRSDLWVIATDGKGKPTKLTFDRANDRHIKWSADGKHLYFLGNRKRAVEVKPPFDGATQVWRVAADGSGEVKAITREAGGVTGYDYAAKADALFFSKDKEHADDDEFAKLRAKAKLEYGHGVRKVSEIHKLDLTAWRTEKLVDDTRYVREFAVTQDGKKVAMVSALDDTVVKSEGESRVDVWTHEPGALATGKIVTPPTDAYRKNPKNSPYAWLENLCWNQKGTRFAFTAVHDAYPAEVIVGSANGSAWETARHERDGWEVVGYGRTLGSPIVWLSPSKFFVATGKSGKNNFRFHQIEGTESRDTPWLSPSSKQQELALEFAGGGTDLAVSLHGSVSLPQLTAARRDGALWNTTPLSDPNPHVANWKLPSIQHVTWKAADGSDVGGVLELPPGYKKGDKLPLVVAIHGGPTTSTTADLNFDPHNGRLYFAAAGYAVLLPNYRGSTGYGDKFVTDLIGKENDIEVKDILAGIQHLVKEGIADPDRVGCMGWSNGGYLTNCLITLKDSPIKFKAASSGAGIVDTVAEWGFNDEPAYPIVFKKGLPWEQPDVYKATSPTYQLGNVKTPTLIHVGGGDERCPPGHSRMLYRALKENLKVPTELIVYPGEPHGLTKMSNRRAKMEWDLAWFDKYLKAK